MKSDAERRAFLETLKPQMVEILESAVPDGHPIDHAQLRADADAELKEYRAKHRRRRLAHAE